VLTCCLKTHQFGGHFTLSLKCAVGMLPEDWGLTVNILMNEMPVAAHRQMMPN
jgi:uncharacterized protein (DUF362 family)